MGIDKLLQMITVPRQEIGAPKVGIVKVEQLVGLVRQRLRQVPAVGRIGRKIDMDFGDRDSRCQVVPSTELRVCDRCQFKQRDRS